MRIGLAGVGRVGGESARRFQRGVTVGTTGFNVPIPVPMAYNSLGGWEDSLVGQSRNHGADGVAFYTAGASFRFNTWPERPTVRATS
jgi:hypothetical protein